MFDLIIAVIRTWIIILAVAATLALVAVSILSVSGYPPVRRSPPAPTRTLCCSVPCYFESTTLNVRIPREYIDHEIRTSRCFIAISYVQGSFDR